MISGRCRWPRLGAVLLVSAASLPAACCSPNRPQLQDGGQTEPVPDTPPPSYAEIASRHNARVALMPSLWARTVVRVWFPDREGEESTEQVEGHFQYAAPDRVLITFDKVGTTYAMLGSNAERYWWIELGDQKKAFVGTHARATPGRVARLGVPVYPLDLIQVVGMGRLPSAEEAPAAATGWADGGRTIVVSAPVRSGTLRLWLDASSMLPVRADITAPDGTLAIRAEMTEPRQVALKGELFRAGVPVTIPGRFVLGAQDERVRLRMTLSEPEAGGSRPRSAAFDLDRILDTRGVRDVVDLDAEGAG